MANVRNLDFIHDTQKTKPQPDPYVTQLADLTQQDTDGSVKAAVDFNNGISNASTVFFDGVYSDGFVSRPSRRSLPTRIMQDGIPTCPAIIRSQAITPKR